MSKYRVLIETNDAKGLVYKISNVFYSYDLNIVSNNEFVDKDEERFFMRSEVVGDIDPSALKASLQSAIDPEASIKVIAPEKKRIVLMVTKESHALGDLLIRYEAGELNTEIVAVISNYAVLEPLVKKFNIPFYTISHEGMSRDEHDARIVKKLHSLGALDYIVLAKYMRILSPAFVETFANKMINIHHSFLPAFIGANPYKQAYERGVKIIGATAHFVSNDLDEGPIIEQNVIHVDHAFSWKDMQQSGRDVEKIVLSRALKLALEDKIFVYSNKTVIF